MKVLLINGSPNEKGCTQTALSEVAKTINDGGIETEFYHIGKEPMQGCIACRKCAQLGKCVFNDGVNEIISKAKNFDGLVLGSPVYYASANGSLLAFLDRLFFAGGGYFAFKPAAAVVSARRAGTTCALDRLNKYFTISQMPIASSQYWNMVHGNNPDEVKQDLEGLQTMRTLGKNLAWLIKSIDAAKKAGVPFPEAEEFRQRTNFIR
ncbi:flavodoxin family protein [Endomicrobium proavitum]|uniref:NADPH-dependent FMN reductase family protein n=1 Tax=Endomicrobium proavitum TaxID=1408281 RepID=A0A0G3WKD9_9BACT|nr:flavodoxin family protein [Endomicrobium proavitum]AKL98347.1 NADPH-dependent FMN reductase family protein [Endomicrobium proavitum]